MIPQGITFAKCKLVGSAGSNAIRDYPLETSAICQALLALAEVSVNAQLPHLHHRITLHDVLYNMYLGCKPKRIQTADDSRRLWVLCPVC